MAAPTPASASHEVIPQGPTFLDRGRALTIVAESLCLLAWLLGLVAIQSGSDLGLLALILGAAGLLMVAVAFFLLARLGRLSLAAGWTQASGIGLALLLFLGIPAGREFGKLGAFIIATVALGVINAVAHLLASLGPRQSGFRLSGTLGLVASAGALATGLLAFLLQSPVLYGAVALSVIAHASVLAGAIAPHPKANG
ncbi:MAG TPA: hypothetical protein PK095_08730 [Myxococcota bacterium]|nr:hypothetical protein [Myxococcota bacterium]